MRSEATTPEDYLAELPLARRVLVATVRDLVNTHLPEGFTEGMGYGMIGWSIPLADYPKTHNKQPLSVVSLAAQKNNFALYLTPVYSDPAEDTFLRKAFADAGLKPNMGKSCVRFKKLENLPLAAIGELLTRWTPARLIETYEAARAK